MSTPANQPPLNQLTPQQIANQPVASNSAGPPLGTPGYGGLTVGPNGAFVRTIDPATQTTSGQLSTLMQSSSPLEQLAQAQGMNEAAARGSANGTLFAGASMAELNKNLTPIAAQNAQVYERQAQANEDALNQAANVQTQAGAQEASAGIMANASIHGQDVGAETARRGQDIQSQEFGASQKQQLGEFNTNWANTMQQTRENQNWLMQDQQSQNEFSLKSQVVNGVLNTALSDPSLWNNPAGVFGMLNDYTTNFGSIIDQLGMSTYGQQPAVHR